MNNKINCLQLSSIMIALIITGFLGTGIFSVIKSAKIDAYISVIIAGIIGFILLYIMYCIFNYEPTLPIHKKIEKIFGKIIGTIINTLISIIILLWGVSLAYNLNNFVVTQFLTETPFYVVGALFASIAIIANIKGLETLTRTSLIMIIVNIVLYLIAFLGLTPDFDFNNLKPILATGIEKPLLGTIYILAINISSIFFILIVPKKKLVDNNKYKKYFNIAYIISIFIMITIMLTLLANLGIYLAEYYQYPEYMVLKRIHLFSFLDRIENILIIQWIFGSFISLSFIVYYLTNSIKYETKSKLIPIIITIIILGLSLFSFKNNTIYNMFIYNYSVYIKIFLLFIYVIIAIGIKTKKQQN